MSLVFEEPTAVEVDGVVRLRQLIRVGERTVTIGGTLTNAGPRAREAALEVMREQERHLRECPVTRAAMLSGDDLAAFEAALAAEAR